MVSMGRRRLWRFVWKIYVFVWVIFGNVTGFIWETETPTFKLFVSFLIWLMDYVNIKTEACVLEDGVEKEGFETIP